MSLLQNEPDYVTPAQAGVQERSVRGWIPAFAGMTWAGSLVPFHSIGGSVETGE